MLKFKPLANGCLQILKLNQSQVQHQFLLILNQKLYLVGLKLNQTSSDCCHQWDSRPSFANLIIVKKKWCQTNRVSLAMYQTVYNPRAGSG